VIENKNKGQKNSFSRLISGLFGSLNWQPAPWMQTSISGVKNKPSRFIFILLTFAALLALAKFSYDWYLSQPQDIAFDASIIAPITPPIEYRRNSKPGSIQIKFMPNRDALRKAKERAEKYTQYEQEIPKFALRLEAQEQKNLTGIKIEPFVEGTWSSDKEKLYFHPSKYWPASTSYKITFPKKIFLDEVVLSEDSFQFETRQLQATLNGFKLHSDDNNPAEKRAIGTLEFNYPIAKNELKDALNILIRGKDGNTSYTNLDYVISDDEQTKQRRFYINSDNIRLSDQTQYLKLELSKNLNAAAHIDYLASGAKNAKLSRELKDELSVPSIENFFKVARSHTQIVRDENDNPQQVVIIELTDKTTLNVVQDYFQVYLLPPKDEDRDWDRWSSAAEIVPVVEEKAELLKVKLLPTEHKESRVFSMVFDAPERRQLLIKFNKGASSSGGYVSSKDFRDVTQVPAYPKEIQVMGSGSILNLAGDHQVGFVSRGVQNLKVRINQVRLDHINHLISQTGGRFQDPSFNYLSPDSLSIVTERELPINMESAGKPSYSSATDDSHY